MWWMRRSRRRAGARGGAGGRCRRMGGATRGWGGGRADDRAAFRKIGVVTVGGCGWHAPVLAVMGPAAGGKGSGEQSLARKLYPRLEEDWLVIADRNFYNWKDWGTAAGTGAALLWRMKENAPPPGLGMPPHGSYPSRPSASRGTGTETGPPNRRGP